MESKTFLKSVVQNIVDDKTGDVYLVETNKIFEVKEEDLFSGYYKILANLYDIKYIDDLKLLTKLSQISDDNGRVLLPSRVREKLCEELKLHTTNLSKSLKRLREKDLIQGERGEFVINSNVFWKGDKNILEQTMKEDGLYFTIKFSL